MNIVKVWQTQYVNKSHKMDIEKKKPPMVKFKLPMGGLLYNTYKNALVENFFSILKAECIYCQKIDTYERTRLLIGGYIHFCNHERNYLKTKQTSLFKRCLFVA